MIVLDSGSGEALPLVRHDLRLIVCVRTHVTLSILQNVQTWFVLSEASRLFPHEHHERHVLLQSDSVRSCQSAEESRRFEKTFQL